jgi:hypothetical protein
MLLVVLGVAPDGFGFPDAVALAPASDGTSGRHRPEVIECIERL